MSFHNEKKVSGDAGRRLIFPIFVEPLTLCRTLLRLASPRPHSYLVALPFLYSLTLPRCALFFTKQGKRWVYKQSNRWVVSLFPCGRCSLLHSTSLRSYRAAAQTPPSQCLFCVLHCPHLFFCQLARCSKASKATTKHQARTANSRQGTKKGQRAHAIAGAAYILIKIICFCWNLAAWTVICVFI